LIFRENAVVDDSEETLPAQSSDIETEVKELMGLFDLPAFARRGHDLEATLGRLHLRCRAARRQYLEMVHLRLRQWSAAAAGPESWRGIFTSSVEPLWSLAEAEPPRWGLADAPQKRRKAIARDLVAAIERFNRRWRQFIAQINLEPTNFAIEQYNRYYVLEKECVVGSARLAARHFTPVPVLTALMLLEEHGDLPVPELVDRRGRALPG
jgi:hypothetical protein